MVLFKSTDEMYKTRWTFEDDHAWTRVDENKRFVFERLY